MEMMGGSELLGKVDKACASSLLSSPGAEQEGPPSLNASGVLQSENEKLKTLLVKKDAEHEILKQKISRLEAELVWEIEASGDMVLETEKTRELLQEKDVEIQELKKALGQMRIVNYISNETRDKMTGLVSQQDLHLTTQEEKVFHLFPDVLKIIIQTGPIVKGCIFWRDLLPILTTCRLVCASWKDAVDHVMQRDSSHVNLSPRFKYLFGPKYRQNFTPCPLKISYDNFDEDRWTTKLETMLHFRKENPSYNPIATRHLMLKPIINPSESEKWEKYCGMVTRYLKWFGRQVWYLTIWFRGPDGEDDKSRDATTTLVYKCLSDWFSLLPNLQSLSLCIWVNLSPMEDGNYWSYWRNYLGQASFPNFKDLVTFEGFRESPLTYKILEKNPHVGKLKLSHDYGAIPSRNFMQMELPNLWKFDCHFKTLESWKVFGNVGWRLEDLTVGFHYNVELTTAEFFDGLAKFGNSLSSLTFNLTQLDWSCADEIQVNLPQLKHLHVISEQWEQDELPAILVQLKNLETLSLEVSVTYCDILSDGYPSEIERDGFLDYVNNSRDKTDWMNLPKLKSVNMTVKYNYSEVGERNVFVMRRVGLPSVKFNVVKIEEGDIHSVNEMMTVALFSVLPFPWGVQ